MNTSHPIDMILFCPACGLQHVDEAEPGWDNPPHRSHLCHGCKHQWRPADVATNGVKELKTQGENDFAPPIREQLKLISEVAGSSTIWEHAKSGGLYKLLHIAFLESTAETVVVYQNEKSKRIWVRPASEFYDGRFVPHPALPPQAESDATPFPINVFIRNEDELVEFIQKQLSAWVAAAPTPPARPTQAEPTWGEKDKAMMHLNSLVALLGGDNGPSIQLRAWIAAQPTRERLTDEQICAALPSVKHRPGMDAYECYSFSDIRSAVQRLAVLLRSIAHLSDEETSGIVSAATREAAQAEVSAHSARLEYQAAELATLRGELSAAQHSADSAHAACMGWKDEARRLRAVLAQHAERQGECRCAPPQREPVQPLSDEQISNVVSTFDGCADWNLHDFARVIECLVRKEQGS